MSASYDGQGILASLRTILGEVLAIDAEVIRPEARIVLDLDAESIDLVDLRFRLEREFGFRVTAEDLFRAARASTANEFRERFTVQALAGHVAVRSGRENG